MTHLDHSHCWESTKPPCGQKIKHFECCLCKKENPEISAAKSHTIPDDLRKAFEEKGLPHIGRIVYACYNLTTKKEVTDVIDEETAALLSFIADREAKARERTDMKWKTHIDNLMDEVDAEAPLMIKNQNTAEYGCAMCGFKPSALRTALLTPNSKPE